MAWENISVMRDQYIKQMVKLNEEKRVGIIYMHENYIHKNYCQSNDQQAGLLMNMLDIFQVGKKQTIIDIFNH